jgi:mannitol operon transcriptional antiterminator
MAINHPNGFAHKNRIFFCKPGLKSIMTALTTRQRDILHLLLTAQGPLPAASLAEQVQLSLRQVHYDLKGLKVWLAQRDMLLEIVPGIGVTLACSPDQHALLRQELSEKAQFQLVLSGEQRQQLLALLLLDTTQPLILYQLQQMAQVSRTTILKDLEAIETWATASGLVLERRQNYGFWLTGSEQAQRQALAAMLWGETTFGQPLTSMTHTQGLTFELKRDAKLLPLVEKANAIIRSWDTKRMFGQVAFAEAQLGGRFTDDAVLYLALVLAIQTARVQAGRPIALDEATLTWLQSLAIWSIAAQMARHMGWQAHGNWPESEVGGIALHILTAPRNERWPGDLEVDLAFSELIDDLMRRVADAYKLPELEQDKTLRDGLVIHLVPACLRYRFGLWLPLALPTTALSERYTFELRLADSLAEVVAERTAVSLPASEINNIALLLRAAYIRERPNRLQEVIVVCPSGMATAQLLVARLKTRFPHLGALRVVSLRELNRNVTANAELIITTVPLPDSILGKQGNIIQVHPLLLPEDIERITQWLA